MSITYPKPLLPLNITTEADESGFTNIEKFALRNAWRVIKRRYRRHAIDISLSFFTENEMLLERFRGSDGKFELASLSHHVLSVLNVYGYIIEQGMDNVRHINQILTDVGSGHHRTGVNVENIRALTMAVKEKLLNVLKPVSSPTLVNALDKLNITIISYFDEEHSHELLSDGLMKESDVENGDGDH